MNALHLTLRQLQIFTAVARSGSTTAASVEIALSQSATSSAVNELERMLSVRLFDRAGKRLLLNDNGRALLPRALAVVDGAVGIEQMSDASSAQVQALRIGASTTIGNYVLPSILSRFFCASGVNESASWQAQAIIANTASICHGVATFNLDVGLIEGPCHESALDVRPWLRDELVVVASPSTAAGLTGDKAQVSLKFLRNALWLLREPGSGTREVTDQALLPHLRSYKRCVELGSSEAIKRMVINGLGVACLSKWVVEDAIATNQLCVLRTGLPATVRQCHLIVHSDKQVTSTLQAFVDQVINDVDPLASRGRST